MGICQSNENLHDTGAHSADSGGINSAGGDAAAAMLGVNSLVSKVDLYISCANLKNKDVSSIFKKIESKKIITKKELELLKKAYPNHYKNIASLLKSKEQAKFIFDKITMTNTVNDVKNKITAHFSNEQKNNYILKDDQLLWLNVKDKKCVITTLKVNLGNLIALTGKLNSKDVTSVK